MSIAYLDYAATTPVDPRVAAVMAECLTRDSDFGNPASSHVYGEAARARVEHARAQVAALLHAEAEAIVWTSGATESNNLALFGAARFRATSGRHLVTARTEHKSVLDSCRQLEKEGFTVTYLKPDRDGILQPTDVAAALTPETTLVSIMHVNNEIGVVQDIGAIGRLCRERHVAFHVDAAQSAGKIAIDVEAQCIDLLSLTAHKLYGPKGIGALYVRRQPRVGLIPLLFGGGHEQGLRSGTLATHQIAGFGLACEIAAGEIESSARRLAALRARLWEGLKPLGSVLFNGHPDARVAHILNISFEGVEGESLLDGLSNLAVSSGSACNSATREASYVLRALGRSDAEAQAALRFSLGRFSTESEVEDAIVAVTREVTRLRQLSPATVDASGDGEVQDQRVVGEAGSIAAGTWVRFAIACDGERVTNARYKVYGCPHTIAAAAWFAEKMRGQRLEDVLTSGAQAAAQALQVPVEKLGRLLVIEDALRDCQRRASRTE